MSATPNAGLTEGQRKPAAPLSALRRLPALLAPGLLPLSAAIFPSVFLYANNAQMLNADSLGRMLLLTALIGAAVYAAFAALHRGSPHAAALGAFVFLVFFHTYGVAYDGLLALDAVRVTHFSLLPVYALAGAYAARLGLRLRPASARSLWGILAAATGFLIVLNLARIAPVEIERARYRGAARAAAAPAAATEAARRPDIFYLVFDEFAGFEAMRGYWKNADDVDAFAGWLRSQGFYVAEQSHGESINTIFEMARRLNYVNYPEKGSTLDVRFRQIADNNAMRFLKEKGYTTIVFDEARSSMAYSAKPKIIADINYEDDPSIARKNDGTLFDEFGMMVADKTMLRALQRYYNISGSVQRRHQSFIFFTTKKLGELEDVSPKFIYAHLLLPHMPFMFDEDGGYVDPAYHHSWSYYEGNYNYSMTVARRMIENILADADPANPPVIILQSDHGARNQPANKKDPPPLADYPEEYKTLVLNAILIPNCPDAPLAPDMKPLNAFPIVFNCAFNAGIPLH